jgi:hypothetical protein
MAMTNNPYSAHARMNGSEYGVSGRPANPEMALLETPKLPVPIGGGAIY